MNDIASVDPADLRKLAVAIEGANRKILGAVNGMGNVLKSAVWEDPQRQRFEPRFRDLAKVSKTFDNAAGRAVPFLKGKADQIDVFLRGS